jgi:hypothetical protein
MAKREGIEPLDSNPPFNVVGLGNRCGDALQVLSSGFEPDFPPCHSGVLPLHHERMVTGAGLEPA